MMRHLKEADAQQQTVVMIQMENEVGLHGHPRDYCPLAEEAYKAQVPKALTDWLTAHKEELLPETYNILLFVLPPGAFITLGFLIAIVNKLRS